MSQDPITSLSVVIPCYDDLAEALRLADMARDALRQDFRCQCVVVQMNPSSAPIPVPGCTRHQIVPCEKYSGLPAAKNLGLRASTGELVLYLFPGIRPEVNAIGRLAGQLQRHTDWGAVSGRWNNRLGQAEKGYNIRRFPTFAALVFDVMFINKIMPGNRTTRRYKMHDFDYSTLIEAEHANDCAFLSRRDLLLALGGFDEAYHFGWFDQVEMCRSLARAGRPVYFDPEAVFGSDDTAPLINRILAGHYGDYHEDLSLYVRRHCKPWQRGFFPFAMTIGMAIRLAFSRILPHSARIRLLRHYRSYVSDDYIQSMSSSYAAFFRKHRNPRPTR